MNFVKVIFLYFYHRSISFTCAAVYGYFLARYGLILIPVILYPILILGLGFTKSGFIFNHKKLLGLIVVVFFLALSWILLPSGLPWYMPIFLLGFAQSYVFSLGINNRIEQIVRLNLNKLSIAFGVVVFTSSLLVSFGIGEGSAIPSGLAFLLFFLQPVAAWLSYKFSDMSIGIDKVYANQMNIDALFLGVIGLFAGGICMAAWFGDNTETEKVVIMLFGMAMLALGNWLISGYLGAKMEKILVLSNGMKPVESNEKQSSQN